MRENRNQADGILFWATRLQMWGLGFRLRLLSGLVGAAIFSFLLFIWRPPLPVSMPQLGEGIIFTGVDAIKWDLGRYGFTIFYPPIARRVAALPDEKRELGFKYLSLARTTYYRQFGKYCYAGMAGAILLFAATTFWGRREEKWRSKDQYVRGAQLVTAKELTCSVKAKAIDMGDPEPRLTLGGVSIMRRDEITPWSIIGRPQVGKSTAIKDVMDQIILKKIGKLVVFDSKGDYTESHFQGDDLIFAPSIDDRSVRWTIFNDITSLSRIGDMVAALIPDGGKDPMWANGARLILEGLLIHCWTVGKKTNTYLWSVSCLPAAQLKKILVATPGAELAAALLDKPEVATSFSFTVNLKSYLKPLQLLARCDGPFSVREWLSDGKADGLFIVSTPDHQEVLKPLMNLFISTLLTTHKSLPDDRTRRCHYFLDELTVLPKIPGLPDALNFGPSKGLCVFLGFQSYQQSISCFPLGVKKPPRN